MAIAPLIAAVLSLLLIAPGPESQSATADAQALLQAAKFAEARDAFEAILSQDSANADAQAGEVAASERIALQARADGKLDDALRDLLRARQYAPHNPRLLYDLGVLEDEMRLYHDADTSLAEAEQLNSADPNVLYAIARVKMDLGQLAPAEEKMKAYLALRPNDASAHYGLGRIYQIGLQFDKAKAELGKSIELHPVQTEAYFELGDIALKEGRYQDALTSYAKALARDPHHGGALEGSGEAEFKLKHYEEARGFLVKAAQSAPDYPPCHYYLGLTLARLGQKDESEKELATASRLADEQNKQGAGQLRLTPQAQTP